jgi:hypothetical protein
VVDVEGRGYKSSYNDMGGNIHEPFIESQLRNLNEASTSKRN